MHTPEFCAACHKANLPPAAERLQVDSRLHGIRRVAELEVLQPQSAYVLHGGLHHLPGLPHEARAQRCPSPARRTAHLSRTAGWPATPPCRSTTDSTSSSTRPSSSSRAATISTSISSAQDRQCSDQDDCSAWAQCRSPARQWRYVEALVVIQNKNIGHSLIPEVRDLYEAWTQFTAPMHREEIYKSGYLKPDGMLDPARTALPIGLSM
jgi:hypothetical protein